jgi:glycosyltransferase involved in cell wall biosynthesis
MRLLIFTQTVDKHDEILGFFHGWIETFSKEFTSIDVVCLKMGTYTLPNNVRVHSLGKEKSSSKITYILKVYYYLFSIQHDAVFVHMNEEYVLMCGIWWWLMHKKVILWRNFKTGTWMTRIAGVLSTLVCYTSPESFTAQFKNSIRMPVGIDTMFFKPLDNPPSEDSILFFGRLDPIKKVDLFIDALTLLTIPFSAHIFGSPTYPHTPYEETIKKMAQPLIEKKLISIHGGVPHTDSRELFQTNTIYVNLTPSGSFDKTIIEAMASGTIVICVNTALSEVLPDECIVTDSPESVAQAIHWVVSLNSTEKNKIRKKSREYAEKNHSLLLLSAALKKIL